MRVTTESGKSLTLGKQLGEGGEARIYSAPGNLVAKVYKGPDDPSFATGGSEEQRNRNGAGRKLQEIWSKLSGFPHGLAAGVIEPLEVILEKSQKIGYLMPSVPSPHARLRDWMDRSIFQALSIDDVREAFLRLADTLAAVHQHAVVGDFNDLNVLIPQTGPVLIDADSFQYGKFPCRTFQQRFVDPLICDPAGSQLTMIRPHTAETDWYALRVMLYQVLRGIGPYDGIHKPKGAKAVPHAQRPLRRVTVHKPEVIVPKFATPVDKIHPDLMHDFVEAFDHDKRTPVTNNLLYLIGQTAGKVQPQSVTRAHGKVVAEQVDAGRGKLLHAQLTPSGLAFITSIRSQVYRNGATLLLWHGSHSLLRFACTGTETVLLHGANALTNEGRAFVVDLFDNQPVLAVSPNGLIYQFGNELILEDVPGTKRQTLGTVTGTANFWYGTAYGLGYYRAGQLYRYFVFQDNGLPMCDTVRIPRPLGQVVSEGCTFGAQAWYWRVEQRRKLHYSLASVNPQGQILCSLEAEEGQGHWLESIRGSQGIGNHLYVPTDNGLLRVGLHLDTTEFPDTSPWVDGATRVLGANRSGLAVWTGDKVFFLKMT